MRVVYRLAPTGPPYPVLDLFSSISQRLSSGQSMVEMSEAQIREIWPSCSAGIATISDDAGKILLTALLYEESKPVWGIDPASGHIERL